MLVAMAGINPAFCRHSLFLRPQKMKDTISLAPAPDKALLDKFNLLCKKMADVQGDYTLGGVINIVDKANPADKMDHVEFLFCKKGDEFYYKLGETLSLNEQGSYIYIDKPSKRVLLSSQKQVAYDPGFRQFADMTATIKSENYHLVSTINGNEQTISLINEHHISCKQYSLTFDKRSMMIKRLYMRLTDFAEPTRKDKEKIVDVSISRWDRTADLGMYLSKNKVIKKFNGRWKTVNEFRDYQLVKI